MTLRDVGEQTEQNPRSPTPTVSCRGSLPTAGGEDCRRRHRVTQSKTNSLWYKQPKVMHSIVSPPGVVAWRREPVCFGCNKPAPCRSPAASSLVSLNLRKYDGCDVTVMRVWWAVSCEEVSGYYCNQSVVSISWSLSAAPTETLSEVGGEVPA